MGRKGHGPDVILEKLNDAEFALLKGVTVAEVCLALGISIHTFYRWRKKYRGLTLEQIKDMKALQRENARLKKAIMGLSLERYRMQGAAQC